VFVVFAVAAALLMSGGRGPLEVKPGQVSPRDFAARIRFTSKDLEPTRAAKERAWQSAPLVFRATPQDWQRSVEDALQAITRGETALVWQQLPEGMDRRAFFDLFGHLRQRIAPLRQALESLSQKALVGRGDLENPMLQGRQAGQAIVLGPSGEQERVPMSETIRLDGEDPAFHEALQPVLAGLPDALAATACRGLAAVLGPTVILDLERSRQNADEANARQPDVMKLVEKGRVILAKGTEVTRQHVADLQAERSQYWSSKAGRMVWVQRFAGLCVLLLIIMVGAAMYLARYRPELLSRRLQALSFDFLALALVAAVRLCVTFGVTPLLVPVPMLVMVMCLVYDQRFGLVVAVFYALLVRLAYPGADAEFFALLLGAMMVALLSGRVRTRTTLLKAGLFAGAAQFFAVWGLGLMALPDAATTPLQLLESGLLWQSLAALANGVCSGLLVSGLLPAIEKVFGVTTDIRLLEWSDPGRPLLQRMLLEAPGSYHHSMVVGSLAADAAEAVGANPLLARVGAYFHDVGKLRKPEYFAENLPAGAPNPHDGLTPSMSSLIITAHPGDGADLAAQYGAPEAVRDIVLQSHGSSMVKYFWGKAQEGDNDANGLAEHSFRYRLPKPQSKEAAIVMLCDAVESAVRSLDSPSAEQLSRTVRDLINDRLNDGQLDESGLTITDLKRLEDSLVHGLAAVFHNRVTYPGQEELERRPEVPQAPAVAGGPREAHAGGDL
jgi:hypothetical protein